MGLREAKLFINGRWLSEGRESAPVINPFSGEKIGIQYLASEKDVDEALQAAYSAKDSIAKIPICERAKILKKAAAKLEEKKEHFARLISMELGKPLKNTLDEVSRSVETLELSGEEAKRLIGETIPGDVSPRGANSVAMVFRVPAGVVAAITPFNAPLNLICHKIGPAFAAGNSIILKPAPQTPLIAWELVRLLLDVGLPENAINMVFGGRETGQQIVKDDRVNVISFTGGYVAGKEISHAAGMKKVLLELGGNAATIIHDDANLARAASLCAKTGFSNSGQSCISVQRIYVQKNIVDKFTELLKDEVGKLKIGDPLDPATDVGCMVDEAAARRVEEWIREAKQRGGEIIAGGRRQGATVEPTIIYDPPKEAKVVCEEVFGPVVTILPYDSFEEAIQEANDSAYGLQAGLFTNRMDLVLKAAQFLQVGGVVWNGTSNFRLDHWPYGGVKRSGIGREGPRYAIEEMTEKKMIVLQMQ